MVYRLLKALMGLTCLVAIGLPASASKASEFGTRGSIDLKFAGQQLVEPKYEQLPPKKTVKTVSMADWSNKPLGDLPVKMGKLVKTAPSDQLIIDTGGIRQGVLVSLPKPKFVKPTSILIAKVSEPAQKDELHQLKKAEPKLDIKKSRKSDFVAGTFMAVDQLSRSPKNLVIKPVQTEKPQVRIDAQPELQDPKSGIQQTKIETNQPLSVRILFSKESVALNNSVLRNLKDIAEALRQDPELRLELAAYASGKNAKRLSLTRALQVRSKFIDAGINSSRLVIKPNGAASNGGPLDRIDISELM